MGKILLGDAESFQHLLVGPCLFNRVEILPLDVLKNCKLQGVGFIRLPDHHRDLLETGDPGSTKAPLPCDDFVMVPNPPDKKRL